MSIKVGDKVRWTHTRRSARIVDMSLKEGTVESIDGEVATVRTSKRSCTIIHLTRLSVPGQPTALDRVVTAIREAGRNE